MTASVDLAGGICCEQDLSFVMMRICQKDCEVAAATVVGWQWVREGW